MTPPFAIFVLFSLSFFLCCCFNGAIAADLIQETCKKSAQKDPNINYKFCVTSLEAVPKSHNAMSLKSLARISIKLAKTNATRTRSYVKKLSKSKTLNPRDKPPLTDCLELYSDAVDSLKAAVKAFKSKDYSKANVEVSSAMDAPSTCEEGFQETKGGVSPLTKRNKDMFQLCAIALSIINMVSKELTLKEEL
ncbi:PREDICTED: putative invertase inhibitor [Nelumbo nucifera]|uniref:Putative invertase inhibitor n=1 Tax=Nelumbo nucifera TaxID=4432 RepID=A0A1U8BE17_NELNU|nr:PREDICTED: putative invertase inhibitor [Nelumbo nucifera]